MIKRLFLTMMLWITVMVMANAQLGLNVTVNTTEAGTLFVKIQEQIEEVGELSDIASLTVTGLLNGDDFNVIRNQLTNMETLDLSNADPECGRYVYMQGHKKVKTVMLPKTATRLEHGYTFCNCTSLETIILPEKLENIPGIFASGATSLASITLPSTVTTIEGSAFQGATSLTEFVFPDGVTTIPNRMFWGCTKLKKVTLPKALTTIQSEAFKETAFETFTLPAGVKLTGSDTFANCTELRSFTFPDGLVDETEVGSSTFWGCSNLTSVRLPQTLTLIPYGFFRGTAIPDIVLPPSVTFIGREAYSKTTALKKVKLPNTIKAMDYEVFMGSSIEEIDWPASATTISEEAFRSCTNLTRINIPETVDSLANAVFLYCSALTKVHLPEGIRTLEGTFAGCTSLSEVNIPSTVTYLDRSSFTDCKSLTHIDIPDHVTYIGWACFQNVPLTEVKLPSRLQGIGGYAFNGCKLKHVVVPEGCLSIGGRAFYSDSLKVLDLPSTIVSLGGIILGDNYKFHPDSVILRAMVPPYASDNMFTRYDAQTTLYVPAASLSLYQANSRYNNVEKMATIPTTSSLLNVLDFISVDKNSGLQQGKYDVSLIDTYWMGNILEAKSDHHPRMAVEEGAQFHIGTLSMQMTTGDQFWFTDYKWQSFINRGTVTADVIDMSWLMGSEHFFTPSFDTRLSDLVPDFPNTPSAFYRYDSGARAAGNFAGTWVRLEPDDILHAGQGYAFRSGKTPVINEYTPLHHRWVAGNMPSSAVNYFLTTNDITLPLQHYNGEFAHNRNWNFIGNPYPAFLDIRGVDYDGPMYVRTNGKWNAVSALDDEFVLDPMCAIFLQAPTGTNNITFSAARRQHNVKFVKDAAANGYLAMRRADKNSQRMVYNLTLANNDEEVAHTRFVINPATTTGFDLGHDLPVMSESESQTLLYTQAGGLAYAINERPLADGIVRLGLQMAEAGTYTLSLSIRGSNSDDVWLIDNETGSRSCLSTQDEGYSFEIAEAGTLNQRFVIALGNADPTGISEVEAVDPIPSSGIYNLSGQPVSTPQRGIYIKDGKKVVW